MSGFWDSANSGQGQITIGTDFDGDTLLGSTGDQQTDKALENIPGSGKGAIPATYTTAAQAVYPVYFETLQTLADSNPRADAELAALLPSNYDDTDPSDFASWHSAHQALFIYEKHSPDGYTISSSGTTIAHFMLDEDNYPINVYALTQSDYAKLSETDKANFNDQLVALGVLDELGLTTDKTDVTDQIASFRSDVTDSGLSTDIQDVFTAQYDLILARVNNNYAISEDAVLSEIAKVAERFVRVETFSNTATPTNNGDLGYLNNPNSLDYGATIAEGIEEFMRAERAILSAQNRREALTGTSSFRDPKLDVPNLIYKLQLMYEAQAEGEQDSGTEEIRQLHKLLEDYAVMQALVNATVGLFNPENADQEKGLNDDDADSLTSTQKGAISMFDSESDFDAGREHPIEALFGATRPTFDILPDFGTVVNDGSDENYVNHRKTAWDSFSTTISDTITILNQNNQIKQNDIEDASKRQNRHFELGNNALRKMHDMIQTIGRM